MRIIRLGVRQPACVLARTLDTFHKPGGGRFGREGGSMTLDELLKHQVFRLL